ncbi:MAG: 2-phospho-L-lactate transferase [Chloroflexota bacterium]
MKIVALAGGVGGAKLVDGLAQLLSPDNLTVVVNTGDDFEHLGLYICPDLDTVCYTLAGKVNAETGWGRAGDSFFALENLALLGAESWFRLGDRDLATHIIRSYRLSAGHTLSEITADFCRAWGVFHTVAPMTDQPVRTIVDTTEHGEMSFQEYFVRRRFEPKVKGFRFSGLETARPSPTILKAIEQSDAIIICPSNPWVSIDPILMIPDILPAFENKKVVAVSPIIGGQTVKGPAAKMFAELGIEPSALAVASHYKDLLTGFVLDSIDASQEKDVKEMNLLTSVTNTLMKSSADRGRLAQDVLNFIQSI